MKAKFYYVWSHVGKDMYGHEPRLMYALKFSEIPERESFFYHAYLGSITGNARMPNTYNNLRTYEEWTKIQLDIEKVERGEIELTGYVSDSGDGIEHTITRNGVRFEHIIFGECPEWPLWSCSLAQYKAALEGWRRFLEMPVSIDSELIIELPDDGSINQWIKSMGSDSIEKP